MLATYGRSIWSGPAIKAFYVLAGFICYILTCLRCLWARAELQSRQLPCPSFQMENAKFLPGTRVYTQVIYEQLLAFSTLVVF